MWAWCRGLEPPITMHCLLVSGQLNDLLRRYYRNHVAMQQSLTKQRVKEIMPLVSQILTYINEKDPRFSKQAICIGSYWQNLKVKEADEFDFNVPLVGQGERDWGGTNEDRLYRHSKPMGGDQASLDLDIIATQYGPPLDPPPPGYVYLKGTKSRGFEPDVVPNTTRDIPDQCILLCDSSRQAARLWEESTDMVRQGDLVPFLVRKRFKQLLTMALRDLKLQDKVKSPEVNGPAFTIKVKVANGEVHGDSGAIKDDNGEVSIDLSPIVPVKLPFGVDIIWPRPGALWPSQDKVDKIMALGVNLVARSDFYWMLTFSHSEKILMDGLDADGGCRKQCHRIMKKINSDVWCNTTKKVIDSYVLKTVWLEELTTHPHTEDWTQDKLGERFMTMTHRLLRAIDSMYLPMYFNPNVNVMKNKDPTELKSVREKIKTFFKDPQILTP